jgi:hypothetical protein
MYHPSRPLRATQPGKTSKSKQALRKASTRNWTSSPCTSRRHMLKIKMTCSLPHESVPYNCCLSSSSHHSRPCCCSGEPVPFRRDFRGGLHRPANPDEAEDNDERMKGKVQPCQITCHWRVISLVQQAFSVVLWYSGIVGRCRPAR